MSCKKINPLNEIKTYKLSNLSILIIMDSQHGARNAIITRNKITMRSKSKQTGNQISINNDAHIERNGN